MEPILKTEALVLYAMRWQESSKIVHLYTAEAGYLKIIAKGAFRPKSPFRGALEALNRIEAIISTRQSRGLQILTSASLLDSYLNIREDLHKTTLGFAVLEVLKKLFSTHEPVQPFFHYLTEWLAALNSENLSNPGMYLWHFLIRATRVLGFEGALHHCLHCGKAPEAFPVLLDYRQGGLLCGECRGRRGGMGLELDPAQWKTLAAISQAEVSALAQIVKPEAQTLPPELTEVLLGHLAHHTEIPLELKSLKWYM